MNPALFDLYVENQLVPTLQPGDVFGLLARTSSVRGLMPRQPDRPLQHAYRNTTAAGAMKWAGAWFVLGKAVLWTPL